MSDEDDADDVTSWTLPDTSDLDDPCSARPVPLIERIAVGDDEEPADVARNALATYSRQGWQLLTARTIYENKTASTKIEVCGWRNECACKPRKR